MPKLVNSSQLTVHRNATTVNRELKTVNCRRRRQGFTLIELLIVITIIGILASIILASYGSIQAKSRDLIRKTDLQTIKKALEAYKQDKLGLYYPRCDPVDNQCLLEGTTEPFTLLSPTYIQSVPKDPKNNYGYIYAPWNPTDPFGPECDNINTFCTSYLLVACFENINNPETTLVVGAFPCGSLVWSNQRARYDVTPN